LFILQVGRNLTDVVNGFLLGKRYLIVDRDTKYSQAFRGLLERRYREHTVTAEDRRI